MTEKKCYTLKINPYYRDLIPPLSNAEYALLERRLLENGCEQAIVVWNDTVIDGHHRYSICNKHKLPFHIKKMHFDMEEEVISWICKNQLERLNINPEVKKYLIGKRYNAEKAIRAKNRHGFNHFKENNEVGLKELEQQKLKDPHKTAQNLGTQYRISHVTIAKYNTYAHDIDKIASINSTVSDCILSGDLKLTYKNLTELAGFPASDLAIIGDFLANNTSKTSCFNYVDILDMLKKRKDDKKKEPGSVNHETNSPSIIEVAEIKKLPKYDPDSEITSLTLTIPSWASSISRTINNSNLNEVSKQAKNRLKKQLFYLNSSIIKMLKTIEEVDK